MLGLLLPAALAAAPQPIEPSVQEIQLDDDLSFRVVPFRRAGWLQDGLLVYQSDADTRRSRLTLYDVESGEWRTSAELELPEDLQIFDVAETATGDVVVGYANQTLLRLDLNSMTFAPLFEVPSMFRGPPGSGFGLVNFTRDLNGDGRDDIALGHFDGWQVAPQPPTAAAPGSRIFEFATLIGPAAQPRHAVEEFGLCENGECLSHELYFRAPSIYQLDHDLDGLIDLAFWDDGSFIVHPQEAGGRFSAEAVSLTTPLADVADDYLSLEIGEGGDEGAAGQRVLGDVRDLNGDGYADLIVFVLQGEGMFGQSTSHEIYYGHAGESRLEFSAEPDAIISSGDVQVSAEPIDLVGDGRLEFVTVSIDFGFGTIVRALFTRSVRLDLAIYGFDGPVYRDEPSVRRRLTATFDFGSGDMFVPAFAPADLDGDGRKDLLVQQDLEKVRAYFGTGDDNLYGRQFTTFEIALPRNGFIPVDLDDDGVDELVLPFNHDDEDRRIRIVDWLRTER